MNTLSVTKSPASAKPKVSELRERFEFIKASFAIEGIEFAEEELCLIEESIRKRHRGPGFLTAARTLLAAKGT